jgi:ribosomal protein L23
MVITINKKATKKEIKKAVEIFETKTKNLSVKDFFGKLKRNIDGLEYQKSKRNEWN